MAGVFATVPKYTRRVEKFIPDAIFRSEGQQVSNAW